MSSFLQAEVFAWSSTCTVYIYQESKSNLSGRVEDLKLEHVDFKILF